MLPTNFSDVELVNKFAEFFQIKVIAICSGSSDCREAVEDCNVNPEQPSASAYMSEFSYITEDQFNQILFSLNNKNYSFDPVPLNLLKLCPIAINPVLHYIVSRSLMILKLHFQVTSSMQQSLQSLRTPIWILKY